ncbi:MAG TPA: 4Fe-4S ferredoxin [Spirochaetaceae bacterium]|nr:4Fe-4S ferredoxin [Spirochaetaceae bacterium]
MGKRTIIEIDQELCDGCGTCETGCPEGALRIIGGKARLVGESLCDGLGACIGHCPKGAIHITERDADEYDEIAVLKEILPQGNPLLQAHFAHLDHHGQDLYLERAVNFLTSQGLPIPGGYERFGQKKAFAFSKPCGSGYAVSSPAKTQNAAGSPNASGGDAPAPSVFPAKPSGSSSLKNWPIQLHLANPRSPHFAGADVVVAADCTAFALGSFHADIVSGKSLVIACPKLDSGKDIYRAKLAEVIGQVRSVSVVIMEVPCCSGLLRLAQDARTDSGSKLPIQVLVVGIDGGFVARKTI